MKKYKVVKRCVRPEKSEEEKIEPKNFWTLIPNRERGVMNN